LAQGNENGASAAKKTPFIHHMVDDFGEHTLAGMGIKNHSAVHVNRHDLK